MKGMLGGGQDTEVYPWDSPGNLNVYLYSNVHINFLSNHKNLLKAEPCCISIVQSVF